MGGAASALFAATLALLAAAPAHAADFDEKLAALDEKITELEPQLLLLNTTYLKTRVFDRDADVRRRISDGEILSLLGDHERAAVVLFDVVMDPANALHPQFEAALYYLAESSYQSRNFIGARQHFSALLSRGTTKFQFDAFARLIAIADILRDDAGVAEQVAALQARGAGALRPDVAYVYGKSLAKRSDSLAAIAQLETVPSDHKFYFRARYVIGSERVKLGDLDGAVAEFERVAGAEMPAGLGGSDAEQARLRELGSLGIARVRAEQGATEAAMLAYLGVAKESPYLLEALYEIAWMYVHRATAAERPSQRVALLKKALQALDILLLAQDDRTITPRARVLKGNVLLRLNRFDDAVDSFSELNRLFEPVYRELERTLLSAPEPERYFNELILKNKGKYSAEAFLPPLAVAWLADEGDASRAVAVAADLSESEQSALEGRSIGQRVRQTLESARAIELFPLYREGEQRARALDAELLACIDAASSLTLEVLGLSETGALGAARSERRAAAVAVAQLEASAQRAQTQEQERRVWLDSLEREVSRLRVELTGANARLAALGKWIEDQAAQPKRPARLKTLRQQRGTEALVVDELERELAELREALTQARAQVLPQETASDRARERFDAAFAAEQALLREARTKTGMDASPAITRLDRLRDRLGALDAGLRGFNDQLARIVNRRVAETLSGVSAELANIARYEQELRQVQDDAKGVVGGIAYKSFEQVRRTFYELVLRSDVGIIDVAWRQKEERTAAINALVKAQRDALLALERDFREIVVGDDAR